MMLKKKLCKLSEYTANEGEMYLVDSDIEAYDLDDFAKKCARNNGQKYSYLQGDQHSTADAMLDSDLGYDNLTFIEFKSGKLDNVSFTQIRRKALESLFMYAYWKEIDNLDELKFPKLFILVYQEAEILGTNQRQRARSLQQKLLCNGVVKAFYCEKIRCCEANQFDDMLRDLKR